MNKLQAKELPMFSATEECLNSNQVLWESILAIVRLRDRLSQNIVLLKDLDQKKSSSSTTPVTVNKEKLKELLDDKTEVLKGIVLSYAHANELDDLVTKVELLAKGFSKKRENDIEPNVKEFLEVTRGLLPELGDYALTEEMIVEAETLRDQFVALVGAPRNMVVKGTSVNEQIESTIKSTKTFLSKQLDNLMLRFKISNVAFYNSYTQARQVVEPATSHRDKPEDGQQPK